MTETTQAEVTAERGIRTLALASPKRLLLAACLDYLMFGAPWAVAVWLLARYLPGFEGESLIVKVGFFAALEILFFRVVKWSPGMYLLDITNVRADFGSPQPIEERSHYAVDVRTLAAERWWTILIGVMLILDGAKSMVRWTQFAPSVPWFGQLPEGVPAAVLAVAFGLAEFVVGAGALRLSRPLLGVGLAVYASELVSILLSWSLLPAWIADYVRLRRDYQGLPVREGEIEFMQAVLPVGMVVGVVAALLAVGAVYLHARKARPGFDATG